MQTGGETARTRLETCPESRSRVGASLLTVFMSATIVIMILLAGFAAAYVVLQRDEQARRINDLEEKVLAWGEYDPGEYRQAHEEAMAKLDKIERREGEEAIARCHALMPVMQLAKKQLQNEHDQILYMVRSNQKAERMTFLEWSEPDRQRYEYKVSAYQQRVLDYNRAAAEYAVIRETAEQFAPRSIAGLEVFPLLTTSVAGLSQ